uniref:PDZ domain-containing protein n=1 Tax=Strigamia maritima TaxID=126957 RepID=T1IPD3_STRMM
MTHTHRYQPKNRNYIDLSTCDEEESSENEETHDNSDSEYSDPEWLDGVSDSGDLFYVGSTLPSSEQVPEANTNALKDRSASGDLSNVNKSEEKRKKKRTGKFKSLIKASKVLKNVDLGPREVPGAEDTSNTLIHAPKVTFHQVCGEAKEVFLDVDPSRHNYGRRASLCEVLFGIIPASCHSNCNGDVNHEDERIMVRGLIPDGEAMCCEAIKIGDWIRSVNDVEVSFLNINQVLGAISSPCKKKICFCVISVSTTRTKAESSVFLDLMGEMQSILRCKWISTKE